MEIGKKTVEIQIETGASCNVLPRSCLPNGTEIQITKRELITYSKSKLSVLGTAKVHIQNPCNNTEYTPEFVVVKDGFVPLLGAQTAQKMNLLAPPAPGTSSTRTFCNLTIRHLRSSKTASIV